MSTIQARSKNLGNKIAEANKAGNVPAYDVIIVGGGPHGMMRPMPSDKKLLNSKC